MASASPAERVAAPAECLEIRRDDRLLTVIIARPEKRNALSRSVVAAIAETFSKSAADESISAVILTGAGDKSFAAGGDLKDLDSVRSMDEAREMSSSIRRAFDTIRNFPVPVVAALNGDAVGGGAELAAACDFRVAAAHSRIGFIQGKLAITTAWGGGIDLCDIVGVQKAMRLTLSGDVLDATRAHEIGLIDAVATGDETVVAAAGTFLAPMLSRPRKVLASFKRLNRAVRSGLPRAELEREETELFAETWTSEEHWAAVAAFHAGRKS